MDKLGKYPKNRIRELRKDKGWSLRELAKRAGFPHYQTLNNLELSRADLTHSHIIRLSDALGCHPLDITEDPSAQIITKDDHEKELLQAYRGMGDGAKETFLSISKAFKPGSADITPTEKPQEKEKKTS